VADVFISYSPHDRARVSAIAERLTSLGYTVTWDHEQHARKAARAELERRLDEAAVVLTIWTQSARNAVSVFAQSARALDAQKLLQLKLDNLAPPAPFNALGVADISGERPEWGPLEDALQRLARGAAPPEPIAPITPPGLFATPAFMGAPKMLAVAGSAAYTGAMTSEHLQFAMLGVIGVGAVCAALAAARLLAVRRAGG